MSIEFIFFTRNLCCTCICYLKSGGCRKKSDRADLTGQDQGCRVFSFPLNGVSSVNFNAPVFIPTGRLPPSNPVSNTIQRNKSLFPLPSMQFSVTRYTLQVGVSQHESVYSSPAETQLLFWKRERWIFNNRGEILTHIIL